MAEQYKKPYLESSVFIAWIKGESIAQTDAEGKEVSRENRADIAKHILSLAEAKQFHIYTSSITITEVHKGNNGQPTTDGDSKAIDFFRNGFFKIIDVDRTIAESAHRFCRSHKLKPYDAVHLACALRAGCDALLTWDSDLLNITHDGIAIAKPQAIGQAVLDLSAPPEAMPPIVATVLDDGHTPGENESGASIPPSTTPDDPGVPERLPKLADPPASEEGKKEDDTPPQNGQESAVAKRPVESGGDGAGVAKGESVEQPHSSPR